MTKWFTVSKPLLSSSLSPLIYQVPISAKQLPGGQEGVFYPQFRAAPPPVNVPLDKGSYLLPIKTVCHMMTVINTTQSDIYAFHRGHNSTLISIS